MSLINLGKYGDGLKRLDTTFNLKNKNAIIKYARELENLNNIDEIKAFIKASKAPKDFVNEALKSVKFDKSLGKRSRILGQLQSTIKELPEDKKFASLGDSLTALGNSFKYLASTGGGMAAIGATGIFGGLAAISTLVEQLNKLRGFDYGANQEKAAAAIEKYEVNQTELSTVSSRLEEIETRKKSLEASGPLSLTDKVELQNLQEESTALERRQKILQTMTDAQKTSAANAAAKSLSTTQESDISGARFDHNINGEAYLDLNHKEVSYMNDAEQILSLVDEIESTGAQIEALQKLQADSENTRDIEKYQKQIDNLTAYQSDLNTLLEGRVNTASTNYEAIAGNDQYKDLAAEYENAFAAVSQMGKSPDEIKLNNLESFFSDSDNRALTNRLQELANEGKLTQDSLSRLGITADMIGKNVDLNDIVSYFNDMATAADNASESINSIDGSFEGVQAAFATENKGAKWSSMAEYLKQAEELYQQGKIGTDDFQSAAQMISPYKINTEDYKYDAEAYAEAWESAYQKVSRWFDTDNPNESMMNFARDLDSVDGQLGNLDDALVNIDESGGRFNIDFKFKSTAEAAKALNTNVEVVEAMLRNLEDYGYEFGDVLFSGENIDQYKSNLDNIKEIYDSMKDSSAKENLGELIQSLESNYGKYQEDLSLLSEEQIVNIKFAYDLAEIQSGLADYESLEANGADLSRTDMANWLALQDEEFNTLSEMSGLNVEGVKIPAQLEIREDAVSEAESQLKEALSSGDDEIILEAQNNLRNAQDSRNSLLEDFNTWNQDQADAINSESSLEDINDQYDEFFSQFSDKELKPKIGIDKEEALEKMEGLFTDNPFDIHGQASIDADNIKQQIDHLETDETINFSASVNNVETMISAVKNENGSITYTAIVDNISQEVVPFTLWNGAIAYKVADSDVEDYAPPEKPGIAPYSSTFDNATPPLLYGVVHYTANFGAPGMGALLGAGADGTLLSPAHAYGTGYNAFNTHPAYAGGKVALSRNETALVNELGTESIIRDGRWMLIPGGMHTHALKKGDIILNAGQTKSLLKWGKATGKGRAYADGTLNAGLSNAYADGTDDKSETFDWIENRIEYLEKLTDEWKNRLDTLTTYKAQNSHIDQIAASMQNEIANLNNSYNAYMAKAASLGLDSSYVEKIQKGELSTEDITDENLKEKIKEYQDWYDKAEECRTSIDKLNIDLSELNEQRIDNIIDDFDHLSSVFNSIIDYYGTMNELAEKQGKNLGQTDYDNLIKYNNELKSVKQEELAELQSEFDNLLKTQENFAGSDQYMDMQEKLFSLKEEVASIDLELENIKDDIVEADFSSFKENTEHLKDFSGELDRIDGLLNDSALFDDKGGLTSTGLTKVALLSEQISTAKQSMAEYENAIDQLDKHLANGNITQEEYNEALNEYREGAQNAAADVKKYREAVINLVKDGLKQELDANKELISARKEALRSQKEYGDYQEKLNSKNKDIQSIQAQLAALSGQSGKGVDRQRRELEARLKELEKEKQDIIDDRSYDMRLEGYDQASDALQENYDTFVKDLETDKTVQDKVITDTLQKAADNYGSVADELNKLDVDMSDDIAAPWLSAKAASKQNQNALGGTSAKSDINTDKIDTSKREDTSVIDSITPPSSEKPYKKPEDSSSPPSQSSGQKSPNDLGLDLNPDTKGLDWLARDTSIRDRMLYNGWAATDKNYQLLYGWAGGQGNWTGSAEQNSQILSALKSAGFSQGGILKATGEDGFFLGRNGEAVLTEPQWNMIRELANQMPVLMPPLPAFQSPESSENVTNVFDAPLIQVEGRADERTVQELKQLAKDIAPMIGREFYKDARKIGLK